MRNSAEKREREDEKEKKRGKRKEKSVGAKKKKKQKRMALFGKNGVFLTERREKEKGETLVQWAGPNRIGLRWKKGEGQKKGGGGKRAHKKV